jgi:hypothetical protein
MALYKLMEELGVMALLVLLVVAKLVAPVEEEEELVDLEGF